jgi:thiol-disulfide isomerase/thioredoxin
MWSLLPRLLLAFAVAIPAFSSPEVAHQADLEEDVLGTPKSSPITSTATVSDIELSGSYEAGTTFFNDKPVPPMKDLTGDGFETEIKDGYWFVKHYSPYCQHCIAVAPTWQTLYEFYYVSILDVCGLRVA